MTLTLSFKSTMKSPYHVFSQSQIQDAACADQGNASARPSPRFPRFAQSIAQSCKKAIGKPIGNGGSMGFEG